MQLKIVKEYVIDKDRQNDKQCYRRWRHRHRARHHHHHHRLDCIDPSFSSKKRYGRIGLMLSCKKPCSFPRLEQYGLTGRRCAASWQ